MTEKEAIKTLEYTRRICGLPEQGEKWEANRETIAIDMAIKVFEEIQQYREIGSIEEIKEILQIISEGQDDVDESGISTGLLHTLLEYAEYAEIGTVEEYREAREKQRAKKPVEKSFTFPTACPDCGSENIQKFDDGTGDPYWFYDYCPDCGQKIDWSEDV